MTRNVLAVALGCVLSMGCQSRADELKSPTAPSNPQNTNFSGTWVGTMSRPGDLGNIAVRWTLTQNQNNVTGPLLLTYNGVTLDGVMAGSWGSDRDPDPMVGNLRIERPGATTLPGCSLAIQGNAEFRGFRSTSTTLTSNTFTINYVNCQGFVTPDQGTSRLETTQLMLNKQ